MQFKKLSETFAVAPQIGASDVSAIAAAGYRSIICNRPDGEAPDQPPFAEIAAEARAQGLAVSHVPVISGMVTENDVAGFYAAVASLPSPVLAYCRSGARCTTLWSMSSLGKKR